MTTVSGAGRSGMHPPGAALSLRASRWTSTVDALIAAQLDELGEPLADACRRVHRGGGKRTRADLVRLVASCVDGDPLAAARIAAAVELLHLATLMHDDLLDGAATRRGVSTIVAGEGADLAVLAGDALLAAAVTVLAPCGPAAVTTMMFAVRRMCQGVALEQAHRFDPTVTAADLIGIAAAKTGALTEAACVLAASTGRASDPAIVSALRRFGGHLGVVVQLIDDVLDVVADEAHAGKPTGVDFADGHVTMPALAALQHDRALPRLLRPNLSDGERAYALRAIRAHGGIDDTLSCARRHARTATAALAVLARDDGGGSSALARLVHGYVDAAIERAAASTPSAVQSTGSASATQAENSGRPAHAECVSATATATTP